MRNFQDKKKFRKFLESKPVLGALGLLVIFFIWSLFNFWGKMEETAKNKRIIENKISELEKGKEKLSADIASLKTDRGVEENIRQKFGLAKEGEGMIVIVEEKKEAETDTEEKTGGFFSFLKNLFK